MYCSGFKPRMSTKHCKKRELRRISLAAEGVSAGISYTHHDRSEDTHSLDTCVLQDILSQMTSELRCPVTAKIRLLDDTEETIEYAKQLQSTGIAMLTGMH